MLMLADVVDAVVGIDTHRDTHTAQLLDRHCRPLAELSVANTDAGSAKLLAWIDQHAAGRLAVAVEGSRSYGIAVARALSAAGLTVLEVGPPPRAQARRHGKSDPLDAAAAARTALSTPVDRLAQPRSDGDREALRMLLASREELTGLLTMQSNRLHALLLAGDDTDRTSGRGPFTISALTAIASRTSDPLATRASAIYRAECRRLAVAVRDLHRQLRTNRHQISEIVDDLAPGLLDQPGIGPVSAATAIAAYSHPGRIRSEAAFAALAGTSPLPASSGQTIRHRLNRGGDRQLNRALHTIARSRLTCDPTTRAYAERRRARGKTDRDILRCLKRYIARQLFRQLTTLMTPA